MEYRKLAEAEYCLMKYFIQHIKPIMDEENAAVAKEQREELRDYSGSAAGFMRSIASASKQAMLDDSLQQLRNGNGPCAMTDEDYLARVHDRILGNQSIIGDLETLADVWREAVVEDIGQKRYDSISATIGADLALSYVDSRMEDFMLEKMAGERKPKSAAEYIIRKGAENSLFGLPMLCQRSPLEAELAQRADSQFKPTDGAKIGAKAVSAAADIASMGGAGSWNALAHALGFEAAFGAVEHYSEKQSTPVRGLTIDECIQEAAWGKHSNVLTNARKEFSMLGSREEGFVPAVNEKLINKMEYGGGIDLHSHWINGKATVWSPFGWQDPNKEPEDKANKVPLVIAPGKEQEYLDWKEAEDEKLKAAPIEKKTVLMESVTETEQMHQDPKPQQEHPMSETNHNSWSHFLQSFGLDGFGDIGRNLPYVLATLPDMLVGLFTGKTESVGLKKDMIPLASILLGLFIKNPLLKMLLIGMGGANLINQMGHESLGRQEAQERGNYKIYADQPLNPRISEPAISGNVMVATIDGVPCQIALSETAAKACAAGALPLNTLANAVLAKHDQGNAMARENYKALQHSNSLQAECQSQLRM